MYKKQQGITLIELILALAIVSILLGSGLPSLNSFIEKSRIVSQVNYLHSILQQGKSVAVTDRKFVTLCPSDDGKTCSKDWSDGYILFLDKNRDRKLDLDETLLSQHSIEHEEISLRWAAFGIKSSLQWHQTGITNHQNGYFEFCYKDRPKLSRALILSKSGRIRHSTDTNGNEIHEDASGDDLACA